MKHLLITGLIMLFSISSFCQGKIYNDSIPSGKNFNKAMFRLWYPADIKRIKGVIILVPGSNGDGRKMSEDTFWQEVAARNNMAIAACFFTDLQHDNMDIEHYINVKDGSGQALLDALSQFSVLSGHKELADAPLFLWGMSAGGEYNWEFVCWKPERIIGFVVNKGGVYYNALAPIKCRTVPGIFFTGEKDLETRSDIVKGIFSMNRRFGALWSFAQEPGVSHAIGTSAKLSAIFLNEIIPLRLSEGSNELKPLDESKGYVGDSKTGSYLPFSERQRTTYPTSWLPTGRFAAAWLLHIQGKPF
jgi:hypothetical protein